jgi:hypothetical protein
MSVINLFMCDPRNSCADPPLTRHNLHCSAPDTWELYEPVLVLFVITQEALMGFGRGALLWLLGIPLPIIILLALFWHH